MQRLTFIFFSLLVMVVLSGALSGCSPSNTTSSPVNSGGASPRSQVCSYDGANDPGIFGGEKVSQESWLGHSVVALLGTSYRGEKSICTGTLIDDHVVLTAAHCADPYEFYQMSVVFSVDPICDAVTNSNARHVERSVSERIVHRGYSSANSTPKSDLALVRFEGDIPMGYRKLSLAGTALPLEADTRVMQAGFGTNKDYNDGIKGVPFDLKFTSVHPFYGRSLEKSGRQLDTSESFYLDQRFGTGACAGDSGGPSLLNTDNGYRVIGVASAVDPLDSPNFRFQGEVTCKKGIVYSSVYFYKSWIEEGFNKLKDSDSKVVSPFEP